MHTPLPQLDASDAEMINAFFANDLCLHRLATLTGRSVADLMMWRAQPHIAAYVTSFIIFQAESDAMKATAHHAAAADALNTALQAATDPIERRRLATTLLRAATNMMKPKRVATPKLPKPAAAAHNHSNTQPRVAMRA